MLFWYGRFFLRYLFIYKLHAMTSKNVFQEITNGYYIVTSTNLQDSKGEKDSLVAATINWLSQVSFNPPMLALALGNDTDLHKVVSESRHFTVHVLAEEHKDLIQDFASKNQVRESTINGVKYTKEGRELVLEKALAIYKCKVAESYPCGDHILYMGEVDEHRKINEGKALCTKAMAKRYSPADAKIK